MEYKSYDCLGEFYFSDSVQQTKDKLGNLEYEEGEIVFLEQKNKTIYIPKYKLLIAFDENEYSVDYFEIKNGDFIFNGINLFKTHFSEVFNKLKTLDEGLELNEEEGFNSKKLGLSVSKKLKDGHYLEKIEFVLAFSREYSNRAQEDVDDIINYYLGDNSIEIQPPVTGVKNNLLSRSIDRFISYFRLS